MLYAAPVWCGVFSTGRKHWQPLVRIQRQIALRVVAAYRTVSHVACRLLGRIIPVDILARSYEWAYWERKRLQSEELDRPPDELAEEWSTLRDRMIQWSLGMWHERLTLDDNPTSVILKRVFSEGDTLKRWYLRSHGNLTFHATQMLTGHGAFATHRKRIGKTDDASCEACSSGLDNPEHVLGTCSYWLLERAMLRGKLGADPALPLSVKALVGAMCDSKNGWKAVIFFCGQVMMAKEQDERDREKAERWLRKQIIAA